MYSLDQKTRQCYTGTLELVIKKWKLFFVLVWKLFLCFYVVLLFWEIDRTADSMPYSLGDSRRMFLSMPEQIVVSWERLLTAWIFAGKALLAC
jgi:hypothetical protein